MSKYVYAITADEYIKFGVAADPAKRLLFLQANCPLVAKIRAVNGPMESKQAFDLEWVIHRASHNYHVRGEWFRLSPKTTAIADLLSKLTPEKAWETLAAWAAEEMQRAIKNSQARS